MTRVKKLNDKGIEVFRQYIALLRKGEKVDPPFSLLDDPTMSVPTEGVAYVERGKFETRLEAAKYLTTALEGLNREERDHSPALWNWLSLFYFDQLCPAGSNGLRKSGKEYRYVLPPVTDPEHFRHYYRHLLAGSCTIYKLHGNASAGRVLLCGSIDKLDDFNEQLASRQEFVTNPGLMSAVDMLYFDSEKEKPKRGAASNKRKPGTLRRFIDVVQQFDLTYDLYSLDGSQLLTLLPDEFSRWAHK